MGSDASEVYVGSIDQGTTSTRFLIFDKQGEIVASHQEEFQQIYPKPGRHEHDANEIFQSVQNCIEGAVKKFESDGHRKGAIKAIGITNQRETIVCWNIKTGETIHNAIVWTDTRTASIARELRARPGSDKIKDLCGLPFSSYPTVTKLLWLLKNDETIRKTYEAEELAVGTVDSWLTYKLNGGARNPVFVTDASNASRTMLMDLHTVSYSDELFKFFSYEFDLHKIHFPKIAKSSCAESYGSIADGALRGCPIAGCLGDQSAALVGQKGYEPGSAKNTYGTGCFLLYNVGGTPVISRHGLLATVAYDFGTPTYALEGSIAVAGSGVKFLMKNFGFGDSSEAITELAGSVEDSGGLVFVTAFSGLFAPYWIDDAQGTMFGITHHTSRGHIARATLEAVCFQTKAILHAMEQDSSRRLHGLTVDGGMAQSDLCMQIQADISQRPIARPKMLETTALGAAIAAGLALGVWTGLEELKGASEEGGTVFEPAIGRAESERSFARWERAVRMCRGWLEDGDEEKVGDVDDDETAHDGVEKKDE
ncbi:glycerol kinase [Dissoconium aciculare CBS 342.82]|uniref:glycerol kinase n=1 Tax=Dissoconium aciculare CBS 342.82 TaxID=1314786 RepID=A0A6J3M4M1_9PEZI|nr:glycerol kinase [Dissoconium aciculare CBS 342.82]KAF1822434.1 glycerol kinase [Dissoconium aciculare CBS 342.82]